MGTPLYLVSHFEIEPNPGDCKPIKMAVSFLYDPENRTSYTVEYSLQGHDWEFPALVKAINGNPDFKDVDVEEEILLAIAREVDNLNQGETDE
jgi:hypothetical protein